MLTIKSWESTFERAETRKIKGALGWVGMPCDLGSAGLCALLMRPDGLEALGVWLLLVEYAAAKPSGKRNGVIKMESQALAFALRINETVLIRSVKALASIGWLLSTWDMPETPGATQAPMPEKTLADAWQTPDREEKRREEEKTPLPPKGGEPQNPKPKTSEVDPDLVSKVIQEWNSIRKRWSLDHWPVARTPRSLSSLAARIVECGGPDPFLEAFRDRLERAAVGYRKPPESGWAPDLAWILKPNGWDKAGAYQRPKPVLEPVTHDMPEGIDFWNPEKSGLRR